MRTALILITGLAFGAGITMAYQAFTNPGPAPVAVTANGSPPAVAVAPVVPADDTPDLQLQIDLLRSEVDALRTRDAERGRDPAKRVASHEPDPHQEIERRFASETRGAIITPIHQYFAMPALQSANVIDADCRETQCRLVIGVDNAEPDFDLHRALMMTVADDFPTVTTFKDDDGQVIAFLEAPSLLE